MFITKKHLSRRTLLRGMGVGAGVAAARFHDAGADAAREDGREAADSRWGFATSRTAR